MDRFGVFFEIEYGHFVFQSDVSLDMSKNQSIDEIPFQSPLVLWLWIETWVKEMSYNTLILSSIIVAFAVSLLQGW